MYLLKISYVIIISALLFFAGCASSSRQTAITTVPGESDKIDETFDPLMLDDEDIVFPQLKLVRNIEPPAEVPVEEQAPLETEFPENKLIEGFRLQLLSTKDLERATRSKAMAQEQFNDLPLKFYLEFDSPYYKVRAGDFKTREEAETLRSTVRSRGYPQAWIVKTKIWSHPELPASEGEDLQNSPEIN